nr:hypothetical protein [Tanacetum cinerariifolium]
MKLIALLDSSAHLGLEFGRYGVSNGLDTAYRGFLGHIGLESLWSLVKCRHRYAISFLMDTTYRMSEQTTVHSFTQPKAPTALKLKKKIITPSFKRRSSYKVRVILTKNQVTETHHIEETVATVDATQSLDASESAEEQVNQPETAEAEKIMDEIDQQDKVAQEKTKSPYDTEYEINIIKRFKPNQPDNDAQITFLGAKPYNQIKSWDGDSDSRLRSMLDDDLVSLTGFETPDSTDDDSKEGIGKTFYASTDMPTQSDPIGHLYEELHTLNTKVDQLESSISQKVIDDIKSSMTSIIVDTLKANLSGLLSKALQNILS